MKRLLRATLAIVLVGVPLALAAIVWLSFDAAPALQRSAELTPRHVERALQILAKHDPRRAQGGALRSVDITAEEADLAANYLANRYLGGSARVELEPRRLTLRASLQVPRSPFGRFVNVRAVMRETAALPVLEALTLGRLPVPAWLADFAFARALEALGGSDQYRFVADTIRGVRMSATRLSVTYEWRADLPERLRRVALPPEEQARIRIYHSHLVEVVGAAGMPREVPLPRLLVPLARLANDRAERGEGGEAQAESRALIAVLAFYVTGQPLSMIVPDAGKWPRAMRRTVTLGRRHDLAQHFALSAALAAYAGSPLADAIGVYKEIRDARGGSGFSFNDIAADRAGTVFGELATRSADSARVLQQRVAAGVGERDMMPDVADLPDFMPEAEFGRRFGGIGAPAYEDMMGEIERRIAACALFRQRGKG